MTAISKKIYVAKAFNYFLKFVICAIAYSERCLALQATARAWRRPSNVFELPAEPHNKYIFI